MEHSGITRNILSINMLLLLLASFCCFPAPGKAYYYGRPVQIVEQQFQRFAQDQPDLSFDDSNKLHIVWKDLRDSYSHIYHRDAVSGYFTMASERCDAAGDCGFTDCGLSMPTATFFTDNSEPRLGLFYSSLQTPFLRFSVADLSGSWVSVNNIPDPSSATTDYSTASIGDTVYFAYIDAGAIFLRRYVNGSWSSDFMTLTPATNYIYFNVDICCDADGFVYLVFEEKQTQSPFMARTIITRIQSISDLTFGTTSFREVTQASASNPDSAPAVVAAGAHSSGDLFVAVAFIDQSTRVACMTEGDVDWVTTTSQMWENGTFAFASSTVNVNAQKPDIALGPDSSLHVIWMDDHVNSLVFKLYATISFNFGQPGTFLPARQIAPANSQMHSVNNAKIQVSPFTGDAAIVFDQNTGENSDTYLSWNFPSMQDPCDDPTFPGWDSHSGIDVDQNPPGHPGNPAYKFRTNSVKGELLRDFGSDSMQGSIDFWFYDPFNSGGETEDFMVSISGDDGTKISVSRMMGVRNTIRATEYAFKADSGDWVLTGRSRTEDWHHVQIDVSDEGILMYLDPETYPDPINDPSTIDPDYFEFVSFNRVELQGGSDAVPYYVDDFTIIAEPFSRNVPSLSFVGILGLLLGFFGLMFRKR